MYVTAFPQQMPRNVLSNSDLFVAWVMSPGKRLAEYCELLGVEIPELVPSADAEKYCALAWWPRKDVPFWFRQIAASWRTTATSASVFRRRYGCRQSILFPRIQWSCLISAGNLRTFMQLAEGVDDETWLYHFAAATTQDGFVPQFRMMCSPLWRNSLNVQMMFRRNSAASGLLK